MLIHKEVGPRLIRGEAWAKWAASHGQALHDFLFYRRWVPFIGVAAIVVRGTSSARAICKMQSVPPAELGETFIFHLQAPNEF